MSDDLLPVALSKEDIEEIAWLIRHLVEEGGFDFYWAGALASVGGLDYGEAIRLKKNHCPQNLVYELLR